MREINEKLAVETVISKTTINPDNGSITWNKNIRLGGKSVGSKNTNGYSQIGIKVDGKTRMVYAHRVIFYHEHGYLPKFVDHIDGNRANNAIANLRPATNQQNSFNSRTRSNNTSGHRGVSPTPSGKWTARLGQKYLGVYKDKSDAIQARLEAEELEWGEFAPKKLTQKVDNQKTINK